MLSFTTVILLVTLGYGEVEAAVKWLVGLLPGWLGGLGDALAVLLYAMGLIIAGWMVTFLSVLLASPFLGVVSARAEHLTFGEGPSDAENLASTIAGALVREARKFAYHLPRLAGIFVLTLIPVVNAAAPLLWFAFGAWMLALHFVDYAAENRGLDFNDTVTLLRANRSAALGFGAMAALGLAVPFAAVLVIPAATCGGALLWRGLSQPEE